MAVYLTLVVLELPIVGAREREAFPLSHFWHRTDFFLLFISHTRLLPDASFLWLVPSPWAGLAELRLNTDVRLLNSRFCDVFGVAADSPNSSPNSDPLLHICSNFWRSLYFVIEGKLEAVLEYFWNPTAKYKPRLARVKSFSSINRMTFTFMN